MVPLNPAWRVRDVVAHMAGVCEDLTSGNFPDISDPKQQPQQATVREAWTQAQVDRRRDVPIGDLLDEWDRLARRWEAVLQPRPGRHGSLPRSLVTASLDVGCHLHDLRHAVGEPGDRDAPTTAVAFAISRTWLAMRLDSARLPAVRMRCADGEWVLGQSPVGNTVHWRQLRVVPQHHRTPQPRPAPRPRLGRRPDHPARRAGPVRPPGSRRDRMTGSISRLDGGSRAQHEPRHGCQTKPMRRPVQPAGLPQRP